MKILVIGSSGMAGHVVTSYLQSQKHTVNTASRNNNSTYPVDIESFTEVKTLFDIIDNDYDFIINCIGLLVKDSIERPDRATIINGWFPRYAEFRLATKKTKLIHLSTDCVFDGQKGDYIESDIHTEINAYGKSKSFGEINNSKDITFRMSIIGPEIKSNGTGLFHWIISNPSSTLQGWDNAWWNGITTLELAKCINKYINNPNISGVYHLVNNQNKINKFDLLSKINDIFELDKEIIRTRGPKSVNKILIDTQKSFNFDILDYDSMLKELKNWMN
jgi:dTDP-4-dehydrorhamnose reductase